MEKRILITGATDGIGLETAKLLISRGHKVLLHGRSADKLEKVVQSLLAMSEGIQLESYVADLSRMSDVAALAKAVSERHESLDVLINNAGVFLAPKLVTDDGLELRFAVNTIAPYLLTQRLLPLMSSSGRVINLSSAAQATVDVEAVRGARSLADGDAYAQSKLALTMWSRSMAATLGDTGPAIIAVNPGSFLGSKMVKEAYGRAGKELRIGAEILTRAALDEEFASASGQYFDNDSGEFASPHRDTLNGEKVAEVVRVIDSVLEAVTSP